MHDDCINRARPPHLRDTIGVIGLGTMGAGIAEVFARNGIDVIGVELNDEAVERGRGHLEHSTDRAVPRGKLTEEEQAELLGRITLHHRPRRPRRRRPGGRGGPRAPRAQEGDLPPSSTTIVAPDAILATNTSSLSVTEISAATPAPAGSIGVHFFNPAPVQNLVEIIRTVVTEPDVVDDVEALVGTLGKNPVVCGDKAGFIANALLFGYLNHAVSMFEGKYATREDIDAAMRFGCGYPMGPLALLDLIGLDTAYEILDTMYKQGRDRLHAPAPILKQMVTAGLLGRKTGRGFYTYEAPDSPVVVADAHTPSADDQPQLRHDIKHGRRGRHRHDGHRHRRGLRQGGLRRRVRRPRGRQGRRRARRRSRSRSTRRSSAASSRRRPRPRCSAGSPAPPRSTTSPTSTSWSRRSPRTCAVKNTLFENLDEICKPGAILATTTSSLPVIALARATERPAGRHRHALLQPGADHEAGRGRPHGRDRRRRRRDRPRALCDKVGKVAVTCGDRAGFIVNALLFPYLNDAVKMLEAHYATADDIDTAMKLGCALPMGPFELLDVVGNDVSLAIQRELYLEFREPGFAPGAAAGAPGHRRLPRSQDPARVPRLQPALSAQADVDDERGQLGARGDLELAEDVGQVGIDGARRDEQLLRDLPAGQPLGHPLGDRRSALLSGRARARGRPGRSLRQNSARPRPRRPPR